MAHKLTNEQIAVMNSAKRILSLKLVGDEYTINGRIAIDRGDEAPKAVVRNTRIYYYTTKLTTDDVLIYVEGDQPYTITEF